MRWAVAVVGCFAVGLKPTSSKDPYALRRAVQGIVQVALNSKLQLDFKNLVEKSYEIFASDRKVMSDNVINDIIELFKQRIANVLSEYYSKDLISYEIDLESNLVKLENRLSVLKKLSMTESFETLINLLKRVRTNTCPSMPKYCLHTSGLFYIAPKFYQTRLVKEFTGSQTHSIFEVLHMTKRYEYTQ